MRVLYLPILVTTLSSCVSSNFEVNDERLYHHVDSLMTNVLKYQHEKAELLDSVIFRRTRPKGALISFSQFPQNPEPLVILNGKVLNIKLLKGLRYESIKEIKVMHPDATTAALFGYSSLNGVILIETRRPIKVLNQINKLGLE